MLGKYYLHRTLLAASITAAVVVLAGSDAEGQAGITVSFPARVVAAPDYATDVLGDAWDMCNAADISPFPLELVGFANFNVTTAPCRAGGATQLVGGVADSNVVFLYRGIHVAVNPGRNGLNFPIDSSKYQVLSYKLNSNLAGQTPQVYWFHNPHSHPQGDRLGVQYAPANTVSGTQIVAMDLASRTDQGIAWNNGPVAGLRIDPNHSAAGQNVFFHWVRLTSLAGAVQRINFSGGTGTATITVRDNSDGTIVPVASGVAGSFFDWNYGVLAPGSYTLTVTKPGSSGTATFTINTPPTIQVTDPSPTTGEDYATRVFGNPWDMSDAADVQNTGSEHTTAISFSGGQATATNTTDDPNVTLLYSSNNAVPIDTNKYRYLTYRFQVDGGFDLGLGSVARVLWSSQQYLNATSTTTSKDILVWPGMNTYTIDLATLSTAAGGGLETTGEAGAWTSSAKRNVRFDPHEFPAGAQARTFRIDDVKLTAKPLAVGFFTIRFAGGDANGDNTTVSLYYDTDTNSGNGKTIIASGLAMSAGQFGWSTNGVPQGDYYIYAEAWDGYQATGRYSQAPVQLSATAGTVRKAGDFDGDGATDITVYRPSTGTWFSLKSSTNSTTSNVYQGGQGGDVPMPADYDGDGRTDVAVYRPSTGTWLILRSSSNYTAWSSYEWGENGDTPMPGDYDADGKADIAVYRPSTGTWFILRSTTNYTAFSVYDWGEPGDNAVPGDYDGDRKTDVAIYRPSTGTWFVLKSTTNFTTFSVYDWGENGDKAVPGDYDGDGKTDVAIYRPSTGTWFVLRSSTNSTAFNVYDWGEGGDTAVPGDYDADGKTDIAVFRSSNGTWFIMKSSTNFTTWSTVVWGGGGDIPAVQQ